jgi:hypothetical protein
MLLRRLTVAISWEKWGLSRDPLEIWAEFGSGLFVDDTGSFARRAQFA